MRRRRRRGGGRGGEGPHFEASRLKRSPALRHQLEDSRAHRRSFNDGAGVVLLLQDLVQNCVRLSHQTLTNFSEPTGCSRVCNKTVNLFLVGSIQDLFTQCKVLGNKSVICGQYLGRVQAVFGYRGKRDLL